MANSVADCDALIAAARRSGKAAADRARVPPVDPMGPDQARHRGGRDRAAAARQWSASSASPTARAPAAGATIRSRVGSWILEEPVHFFDMLMWYFEELGDPVSVQGFGNSKGRAHGMYDNFSTVMRFPGGAYAVVNQTLAGFEHHHVVEIVGTDGSIRTWWSGAMDRTLRAGARAQDAARAGRARCETSPLERSGEVFELEEELAHVTRAFRKGRRSCAARRRASASSCCLEAERVGARGREVALELLEIGRSRGGMPNREETP